MPVTRARLEAFFCETIAMLPMGDKNAPGWRVAQLAVAPLDAERGRWLVLTARHSDGERMKVTIPLRDEDMTDKVIRPVLSGLAELRGQPLAEVQRRLEEPITFTVRATCRICSATEEKQAVDEMPIIGWPSSAGTGTHCPRPACMAEADRRIAAARAEHVQYSEPRALPAPARAPKVSGRAARDQQLLDEHNRAFSGANGR